MYWPFSWAASLDELLERLVGAVQLFDALLELRLGWCRRVALATVPDPCGVLGGVGVVACLELLLKLVEFGVDGLLLRDALVNLRVELGDVLPPVPARRPPELVQAFVGHQHVDGWHRGSVVADGWSDVGVPPLERTRFVRSCSR
jgi:hypothetical protein